MFKIYSRKWEGFSFFFFYICSNFMTFKFDLKFSLKKTNKIFFWLLLKIKFYQFSWNVYDLKIFSCLFEKSCQKSLYLCWLQITSLSPIPLPVIIDTTVFGRWGQSYTSLNRKIKRIDNIKFLTLHYLIVWVV